MKLTSDKIDWKDGENFALCSGLNDCVIGFSAEKPSAMIFNYIVKREEAIDPIVAAVNYYLGDICSHDSEYSAHGGSVENLFIYKAIKCGMFSSKSKEAGFTLVCTIEQFNQCVKELTGCTKEHQAWLTALNDMREYDEAQRKANCKKHKENLCQKRGKKIVNQKRELNRLLEENEHLKSVDSLGQWSDADLLTECVKRFNAKGTAQKKEIRAQIKVLNNTLEVQTKSLQQIKQSQSDLIDSNVAISMQINELEDKL